MTRLAFRWFIMKNFLSSLFGGNKKETSQSSSSAQTASRGTPPPIPAGPTFEAATAFMRPTGAIRLTRYYRGGGTVRYAARELTPDMEGYKETVEMLS